MRRHNTRLAVRIVRMCWSLDAPRTILCFAFLPAAVTLSTLFGFWAKLLVDGALEHDQDQVRLAAICLAGSQVVATMLFAFFSRINLGLQESIAHELDLTVLRSILDPPTTTHYLDASYHDSLALLEQSRPTLLSGAGLLLQALAALVTALATTALLVSISPWLALSLLPLLPALWLGTYFERKRQDVQMATAHELREGNEWLICGSSGDSAAERAAHGAADFIHGTYRQLQGRVHHAKMPTVVRTSVGLAASDLLSVAMFAVVYLAVIHLYFEGEATVGDLVMTLAVTRRLNGDYRGLLATGQAVSNALHKFRLLFSLETPALPASTSGRICHTHEGITLEDVSFEYPNGVRALDCVTTTLKRGDRVAVVGANGSGKTTLVKVLLGLYSDGEGREQFTRSAVLQDFTKLPGPLRDNVGFGHPAEITNDAVLADRLSAVGLAGLTTQLDVPTPGLSGGEWQRVAAARSEMVAQATLRVYDEPSASLDPLAEASFFNTLNDLADRRCEEIVLWVSHRLSTTQFADLVLLVEDGKIVETGSPQELLRARGPYWELFARQAEGYVS